MNLGRKAGRGTAQVGGGASGWHKRLPTADRTAGQASVRGATTEQGSPGHTEQHLASCLLASLERIGTFQLFSLVLMLPALS